jgi:hypothetical protein
MKRDGEAIPITMANPALDWMASNVACKTRTNASSLRIRIEADNKIDGIVAVVMYISWALVTTPDAGMVGIAEGTRRKCDGTRRASGRAAVVSILGQVWSNPIGRAVVSTCSIGRETHTKLGTCACHGRGCWNSCMRLINEPIESPRQALYRKD